MQLAKERCETLLPRDAVTQYDKMLVMMAALLHDVGHGPFSHLFDGTFMSMVHRGELTKFRVGGRI